jgi:hypothetical protein
MAGGGMMTPPRGPGGQTDLIAQRRPQPDPAQLAASFGVGGGNSPAGGVTRPGAGGPGGLGRVDP